MSEKNIRDMSREDMDAIYDENDFAQGSAPFLSDSDLDQVTGGVSDGNIRYADTDMPSVELPKNGII